MREQARHILHTLLDFPDGHSGQSWARLRPGVGRFLQISHMVAEAQVFGLSFSVFLGH